MINVSDESPDEATPVQRAKQKGKAKAEESTSEDDDSDSSTTEEEEDRTVYVKRPTPSTRIRSPPKPRRTTRPVTRKPAAVIKKTQRASKKTVPAPVKVEPKITPVRYADKFPTLTRDALEGETVDVDAQGLEEITRAFETEVVSYPFSFFLDWTF